MYHDSEEGILPRSKIRIRYYDETNNKKIYLEKKISSIEGRFKTSKVISNKVFNKYLKNGIYMSDYNIFIMPQMIIRYDREYYFKEKIRVTFDTNIQYCKYSFFQWKHENFVVTEFKTGPNHFDNFVQSILYQKENRFSKYCNAVKSCTIES